MKVPLSEIFDHFGVKTVSRTDKNKGAYLPNADQIRAIEATGRTPATKRPAPGFTIEVMFESGTLSVEASYYHSIRSSTAARDPEPRMGHQFISAWANEGDRVVIGNVGNKLYALKVRDAEPAEVGIALTRSSKPNRKKILARAQRKNGAPARISKTRLDFVRDPYVVAGALIRSRGKCEMPGCQTILFKRSDGAPFLEVHHVVPLREGGVDDLDNTAALCPMCHRELHFGAQRLKKRRVLAAAIATAES